MFSSFFFRWVCEDFPDIRKAMAGSNYLTTYDIKNHEVMSSIAERYNKAVDKIVERVGRELELFMARYRPELY